MADQSCATLQCRDKRWLVKYAMQCKKNAPENPGRLTLEILRRCRSSGYKVGSRLTTEIAPS